MAMSRTIWLGAVAYDPKVVTIWEGMRRYFHEEANLPVEVVLFQSYEAQVEALLAAPGEPAAAHRHRVEHEPRVLQADAGARGGAGRSPCATPISGWMTKIVAVTGRARTQARRSPRSHARAGQPRQRSRGHPARSISSSARGWSRDRTTDRCASTPTSASTATRARARSRSCARCSTAGRCRRDRQPVLESGAQRAARAGRGADGDLDVAALQSLHVHGARPISTLRWSGSSPRRCSAMSYDNPTIVPCSRRKGCVTGSPPELDGYASLREASRSRAFLGVSTAGARRTCSGAVEDRRQPCCVLTLAVERAAHRGEGFGERKDVTGDQQVVVLRADRMPVDALRRDRDLGHQIRARERDAVRGERLAARCGGSPGSPR